MSSILPISVNELLSGTAVETCRLELKASWSETTTGPQVLETLCAFANDLQNLNGGYIIIGIAENEGVAVRPAAGLNARNLDHAQKWIRGNCNKISPDYMPVLSPENVDGKKVLVLWAPASDLRPHQAPRARDGSRQYFVRIGSETVIAKNDILTRLMQLTARVPFDDRSSLSATIQDLRESRVREFLRDVKSGLLEETDVSSIYRSMQLTRPKNGHEAVRNVALMLFTEDPGLWFRGARIEVVQFADDAGGNTIEEKTFKGPLHEQVRQCLSYLENLSTKHLEKAHDHAETRGWVSYPNLALREAVVNAVYHRSYEEAGEPSKVYLYPNRIEVISYPGPVDGIDKSHLAGDQPLPPVPARNRRIGEFLKELRLAEGRGTGVPKMYRSMRENGSPAPEFDFDPGRTYFRVRLPAHPEYVAMAALREAAYLRATGDDRGAIRRLTSALADRPNSSLLAVTLIREYLADREIAVAKDIYSRFPKNAPGYAGVAVAMADAHLDAGQKDAATEILDQLPALLDPRESISAAITERRAGRQKEAHRLFQQAGSAVLLDPKAAHEFAQTKIKINQSLHRQRRRRAPDQEAQLRLLGEAEDLLLRVVQMDTAEIRRAWAWFDLGRVRRWLRKPESEVVEAFERACELHPNEARFRDALEQSKAGGGQGPRQGK